MSAAGQPALALLAVAAAVLGYLAYASGRPLLPALALAVMLAFLFVMPQAALIAGRGPHAPIQDGLLVTEAAARRLLHGLNPYGHDYLDDAALRRFYLPEIPVNPVLGHYVYPPGLLLLALPWEAASGDFAWAWPLGVPALAGAAYLAAGRGGVIAVALSPVMLIDELYLLNDLYFLAAALAAIGLLRRRRGLWAGVLLALALAFKQQAVLLVPAIAFLAWRFLDRGGQLRLTAGLVVTLGVLGLPFALWSPGDFLRDTAAFFYGSGLDSYPIRGIGLPGFLLALGVVPSRWAAYPAGVVQAVVLVPLLVLAARDLARRFTWPRFWVWVAAEVVAVFTLGRYVAPNYVSLMVVFLTLAATSALEGSPPAATLVGGDQDGPLRESRVQSAVT